MDVLLVDTALERNSRNHPYCGIYPRAVDSFTRASLAVEWLTRFTEWLTTWTENVLPTVDFVRARGHLMDGIFEPMTRVIEESEAERAPFVEEVAATRVEGPPVEEAPPVEEVAATRVEGPPVEEAPLFEEVAATRVEGAPVEEAHPVEEATEE
ncbi:hypothetical protein R1sor_023880 [Riccia sorocarpa]|uniref:Uncharacterized protein n=1 Tax=Riccia sorocarpa TaxID=122646 RepID=A0ABD3GR83_9MARC